MTIDIQPTIEEATGKWRIAIDMTDEPRYVVRTDKKDEFSTVFTPKQLDEFQSWRTVSEMMKIWEEGIERGYVKYSKALDRGWEYASRKIFVFDIVTREEKELLDDDGKTVYRNLEIPLTKDRREYYQREVKKLGKQRGKMTFVKLV